MVKIDLLKDSLNYQSQSLSAELGNKPDEDLSDLDFSTPEKFDLDSGTISEEEFFTAEKPESVLEDQAETTEDSLLSDLDFTGEDEGSASAPSEEIIDFQAEETEPLASTNTEESNETQEVSEMLTSETEEQAPAQENYFTSSRQEEPAATSFDYSTTQQYSEFDEERFDSGGGKGKGILVVGAIAIIVLAIAAYLYFFKGMFSSDGGVAETPTPAEVQTAQEIERQKKINDLQQFWKSIEVKRYPILNSIQKLSSLQLKGTQLSMVRFRDGQLILTINGENRDDFANLNVELKNKIPIKNMTYVNDAYLQNVENSKMLITDISIQLETKGVSLPAIDVPTHQNKIPNDVQNLFKQSGLKVSRFNEKPGKSQGNYARDFACRISGTGNFSDLMTVFNQLSTGFPQISINYLNIYSDNLKPMKRSKVTYNMEFEFYQASL